MTLAAVLSTTGVWLLRCLAVLLLLLTVLPFVSSGQWYVRVWDFPRLQILIATVVVMLAWLLLSFTKWNNGLEILVWIILLVPCLLWQGSHLLRFSPLWSVEVPSVSQESPSHVKVMVANLKYENQDYQGAIEVVQEVAPDVLVLLELHEPWSNGLRPLHQDYPYRVQEVRGEGLGMGLWSKTPLDNIEKRYLVSDRRVSIWATTEIEGQEIHITGVHPTPPGLKDSTGDKRRDSRVRDAELVLVAREITDQPKQRTIVAGDFNDVAWSHTTRLFQRLSQMRDPRVGRSFLGTFPVDFPPARMPIDHVFASDGFGLLSMSRQVIPGSDHFAVVADFSLRPFDNAPERTKRPEKDDHQEAQKMIKEGEEDAEKRNVDQDSER